MSKAESLPIENVQDYPRPPAVEPVRQRITVLFGDTLIVDTVDAFRVLETHHAPTYYVPLSDFSGRLTPIEGRSYCEWKGIARYFDVSSDSRVAERAAWAYDSPESKFKMLAGYIAIYASKMDVCTVGDEVVQPQPGDFYGGWQTSNLAGIVKGGPGTEHW